MITLIKKLTYRGSGLPELCQTVANYYKKEFAYGYEQNNVLIGPGSKELLFQLLYLLEGMVLIPEGSWVSYKPQATLLGKKTHILQTFSKDNYTLTAKTLQHFCASLSPIEQQKQKVLILNSPNNPTGSIYPDDELKKLAEICQRYRIIVISDEIYAKVVFGDKTHTSIAYYYPEGTIITGGLSKLFSAGGYRLGVALIPNALSTLYDAMKILISETYSAVSAPIQYAALYAYGQFDMISAYLVKCTRIHQTAIYYVHAKMTELDILSTSPEGAFYLLVDFTPFKEMLHQKGVQTSHELAHFLLEKLNIATLAGSEFYFPENKLCLRLAITDYDGEHVLNHFDAINTISTEQFICEFMPNIYQGITRLSNWVTSELKECIKQ